MHTKSGNKKNKNKKYSMGYEKEKDKGALTPNNEMQQTRETLIQPSRLLQLQLRKSATQIIKTGQRDTLYVGGRGAGGGRGRHRSSLAVRMLHHRKTAV